MEELITICGQMTENPEFDPLGVGDANDVL
jgi:hypothetical protein